MASNFPSIESLFVRDPQTNKLNVNEVRDPSHGCITTWILTEKVDGTNISFVYDEFGMELRGRTDKSQIEPDVREKLLACVPTHEQVLAHFGKEKRERIVVLDYVKVAQTYFVMDNRTGKHFRFQAGGTQEMFDAAAKALLEGKEECYIPSSPNGWYVEEGGLEGEKPNWSVTIYGEGYGPKIQKGGGNYRDDIGFIAFDVQVGRAWLNDKNMRDVCSKLNVPVVPIVGTLEQDEDWPQNSYDLEDIIPRSVVAARNGKGTNVKPEGIVARPEETIYNNRFERIQWKLCFRDLT